ncbi:membrane cofactor protein isoform X3 [Manis pentadactyla]|uniref:membrane cofactor protein isoform X3 n=1 Tax=Manis pentadactyla TaxID=143292 RepID=UPI00255D0AF5|nr:membrane cofactor protein isoform X3 [Manis pentadactyla]
MTAPRAPRSAPPGLSESPSSSRCFVGILSMALVLLLPISSDACGDPPKFNSMRNTGALKDSYNPGDKVDYECRLGYQRIVPFRPTSTVCQPDNTWAPPLQEACTRKSCPHPVEPTNGQVNSVNGSFVFGSQVHYSCNEGFDLIGQKILYCEISAETNDVDWSHDPPLCEKILCAPPPKIPNGKYTNSDKDFFVYNEVVTYSCDRSSGPDEYSLVGESTLICSGRDVWSSAPPQCKVVKCESPNIQNGKLESGFSRKYYYKATIVFSCDEGYYYKGTNVVTCGAESTWEPGKPECFKVPIPATTKPPILSHSGSTPTHTTTPPVSSHPGRPDDGTPPKGTESLGGGIIAVIVLSVVVGIAVIAGGLYAFLRKRKRGKTEVSAAYSTYQNKSTNPA